MHKKLTVRGCKKNIILIIYYFVGGADVVLGCLSLGACPVLSVPFCLSRSA